ncbi:MAG: ABC transporter ATP-binding protein [Bacilli bacterium]|nr:ABC transporter ATP-binding protein [Bacilli bacterium]
MKAFFKSFRYALKIAPSMLLGVIIQNLASTSLVFVTLLYGGNLLDLLVNHASVEVVQHEVIVLVSLVAGLTLIQLLADIVVKTNDNTVPFKVDQTIARKSMEISYDQLESQKVKNLVQSAEEGSNGFGGFSDFIINTVSALLKSVLTVMYAIILFGRVMVRIESTNTDPLFVFLNNPYSFLIIVALLVMMAFLSFFLLKYMNKLMYAMYKTNIKANREGQYLGEIMEDYRYAKDFRIYNYKDMLMRLIDSRNEEVRIGFTGFAKGAAKIAVIEVLAVGLLLFVSYLYIGAKAYFGIITVGSIVTVVGAISSFATSINEFVSNISNVMMQTKYLGNYFEFLELPVSKVETDEKLSGDQFEIEFKDVYFKYPNTEDYALKGVSFKLTPLKKLAIVGRNGAGKSTIIKLIARFYHPDKGEILVNGKNIETYEFADYQKILAILFQDFNLFAFTIKQNVSSSYEGDEEKVKECLDRVGYDYHNSKKLVHGLDTYLFNDVEDGIEMSGGEQQKVAIARALYKNSSIILLDEPTSALDPKSELVVYQTIEKLVHGRTSLFISHRMSSTMFCDKIIVLDKGKIVQEGNHQSLMQDTNNIYASMFNEQAKYYK